MKKRRKQGQGQERTSPHHDQALLLKLFKDQGKPLSVKEILGRLKGGALFGGFRGGAAVDLERLADIVVRVSEFAADQQARISELDINPIICSAAQLSAVDALIVRQTDGAAAPLPL